MNNKDFKIDLINRLKQRNIFTQQVSISEVRTRCPYCGDSRTNRNTGHFYIRINPNDDYVIVYNCFKCPASGILTYNDLELLGIEGLNYKEGMAVLNRTSVKPNSSTTIEDNKYFNYELPSVKNYSKVQYIENRLGYKFELDDLRKMKVITSLKDFLVLNKIDTITCKPYLANKLENQYVGFLSNNGAYILFRDVTDKDEMRWVKYPITENSRGQKVFYSIQSEIDLYSKDDIIINLSEGIMDAVSICYNLNNKSDNILNIAVCGKYYSGMIKHLITSGFVGSNIIFNIYSDREGSEDLSPEYFKKILSKYTFLVKEINLYYNLLSKDCGVEKERIKLQKYKI